MNNNNRLNGAYVRLGMPQARVTDAEQLLILRDLHKRLIELEEADEKQECSERGGGVDKLPKGKVSTK
jgi:hypothetical protein